MRLIGKFSSPYVRRVAVSLHLLDMPFAHDDLSVLRDFAAFAAVNPIVKAPTLVTDDGTQLVDSTLILAFIERAAPPERRLAPDDAAAFARHQRIVGLALAACEKTVQIVYEHKLRPAEKRHQPWLDRVGSQLAAAYALLEAEAARTAAWLFGARAAARGRHHGGGRLAVHAGHAARFRRPRPPSRPRRPVTRRRGVAGLPVGRAGLSVRHRLTCPGGFA